MVVEEIGVVMVEEIGEATVVEEIGEAEATAVAVVTEEEVVEDTKEAVDIKAEVDTEEAVLEEAVVLEAVDGRISATTTSVVAASVTVANSLTKMTAAVADPLVEAIATGAIVMEVAGATEAEVAVMEVAVAVSGVTASAAEGRVAKAVWHPAMATGTVRLATSATSHAGRSASGAILPKKEVAPEVEEVASEAAVASEVVEKDSGKEVAHRAVERLLQQELLTTIIRVHPRQGLWRMRSGKRERADVGGAVPPAATPTIAAPAAAPAPAAAAVIVAALVVAGTTAPAVAVTAAAPVVIVGVKRMTSAEVLSEMLQPQGTMPQLTSHLSQRPKWKLLLR
ncbi:hypothetical protein CYMTET_8422 [Cymbomonas tetramitiformis]|uniref:Uncharacterized protein n=1 Tax=Cymbomonas tetramitiformis TaxID=36881 RepID=A0AAE0GTF8_9CHLO|nr:hypothetical protein CYMTET_8422 [Cymbomonas tetramitiformis]